MKEIISHNFELGEISVRSIESSESEIEHCERHLATTVREPKNLSSGEFLFELYSSFNRLKVLVCSQQGPEMWIKKREDFKQELLINPNSRIQKEDITHRPLLRILGESYEQSKHYSEVLSCYETIIENYKKPKGPNLDLLPDIEAIFRIQRYLGIYDPKDALKLCRNYLTEGVNFKEINNVHYFELYAKILEENGRKNEAVESYKWAYKIGMYTVNEYGQHAILDKIAKLQKTIN